MAEKWKCLAGIVLFNPEWERLKENLFAVANQADKILLIDNGSADITSLQAKILSLKIGNIEWICNAHNMGIAAALNQVMNTAAAEGARWVLALDQDSVCSPFLIETYYWYLEQCEELQDAGILTCRITDRNFTEADPATELKREKYCITSGSLIRVDGYLKTNGFDERMFIDSVDFDFCIQMRQSGYQIWRVPFAGLLHEVGHGKNVRILNRSYIAYGHSPERNYFMARNMVYLYLKYPGEWHGWKILLREIRMEMVILFYEDDKKEKIIQRWKGIHDSFKLFHQFQRMNDGHLQ